MRLKPEDYQVATFFGLIVLFSLMERFWPAHRVDRWKDLKVDVLSFAFALAANQAVTIIIGKSIGTLTPPFLQAVPEYLRTWNSAGRIVLALFVVDFVVYWIHRSQHTFELMWRTHAWHHSIEHMYWFAGFRTSFLHSLLNNIPVVLIPVVLLRLSPVEVGIGYSIGAVIQFVEHTNCRLSFGPLNWLLVTPDYHRIHHAASIHRGRNLAGTFRIWDRMFGTYVDPAAVPASYALGLDEKVEPSRIPRMLVGV